MNKFKITIDTVNDAFEDYPELEVARILKEIAEKIEIGFKPDSYKDFNGNTVAKIEYL